MTPKRLRPRKPTPRLVPALIEPAPWRDLIRWDQCETPDEHNHWAVLYGKRTPQHVRIATAITTLDDDRTAKLATIHHQGLGRVGIAVHVWDHATLNAINDHGPRVLARELEVGHGEIVVLVCTIDGQTEVTCKSFGANHRIHLKEAPPEDERGGCR